MKTSSFILLLMIGLTSYAQDKNENAIVTISPFLAQFMVSTDLSSVYLNFVGAGIKYSKGNTSISLSVFPSLRFFNDPRPNAGDPKRPFITPGLAAGPLLHYKRLYLGLPAFYDSEFTRWRISVGAGLRIGK